ncbi:hypothetical protein Tco_0020859, partial [Tanacetum coccineum]
MLTQADFEGQAYEVVKAFYPNVIYLQFQMLFIFSSRWRSVTICSHIRLTRRIQKEIKSESMSTNHCLLVVLQGRNPALSISKMKAASYPDIGLEPLVPKQMWVEDVCSYDISAKYGISDWWFNRQKFYIERHDSPSHRKDVKTHMRILSVVKIKTYLRYGDFEDLNLLLLQGHLNHLPGLDKQIYQTQLNLTKPGWDATGYKFKHDYTIIESPRVVIFLVNNNEQKIMRFNEIYKFSDGTLTRILEALDYKVKEFKIKRLNP